MLRLVRSRDEAVVVEDLEIASSYFSRLRGLMGRSSLPPGRGLWLEPCSSIHMMFVRFPIDVVFLRRTKSDRNSPRGEVLKVCPNVRPWVGLAACMGASCTLELAAGRAALLGLEGGDMLSVEGAA